MFVCCELELISNFDLRFFLKEFDKIVNIFKIQKQSNLAGSDLIEVLLSLYLMN